MNAESEGELLLVEDNPHDVELALRALRKARPILRVQVARDGVEALDYVFGEGMHAGRGGLARPSLILLDLKLPKVDGFEVLRCLKADPRTQPIPIVVLTTSREQRDVCESYRLGVNSYVVKPVDFDRFSLVMLELGSYWLLLNQPPPPGG